MDRSAYKDNPAWATHAIADSYDLLEDRVPPEWLPRLDKVAPAPRGKLAARIDELGCGLYGCVLPTLSKDVVLKVTTDQTEADFASGLADTLVSPICVRYMMVVALAKKHEGRPIYLLWRDAADHVGGMLDVLDDGERAEQLVKTQHEAAQGVLEAITAGRDVSKPLVHYKDALHSMRSVPEIAPLAKGLLEVLDRQGIFIGDLHGGNLGLVRGRWVITDPGHVVFLAGRGAATRGGARRSGVLPGNARTESTPVDSTMHDNPHMEGVGSWRAAPVFADTMSGRMLRMLWERGSMTQAEFMQRYHRDFGEIDGARRATRMTDGKTAFLNNFGHFVRGASHLPDNFMPSQDGIRVRGKTISTTGGDAYARVAMIRLKAVEFLLPIERRIGGNKIDGLGWAQRAALTVAQERGQDRAVTLHWIGPSPDQWLQALTLVELDKAFVSMEAVALATGRDDDTMWFKRIYNEVARRSHTVKSNPRRNPDLSHKEVLARFLDFLLDPDPMALEVATDLAETYEIPVTKMLYDASTDLSRTSTTVEAGGEIKLPDASPLRPGGPKEKVRLEWQIVAHEGVSREWFSPRLHLVAPLDRYFPDHAPPAWPEGTFFVHIHFPGGSWVIKPGNPVRFELREAKDTLMAAAWAAIHHLRPPLQHALPAFARDVLHAITVATVGACDECGSPRPRSQIEFVDTDRLAGSDRYVGDVCKVCRGKMGID